MVKKTGFYSAVQLRSHLLSRRLLLFAALLFQSDVWADGAVGLVGRLFDASHLPLAGATITVTSSGRATERSAVSDTGGTFRLSGLQPGSYVVKVSKTAFQPVSRAVQLGTTTVDIGEITVAVAAVQSTVQVTDDSNYVTTDSSASTRTLTPLIDTPQSVNVISEQQVRDQLMLSISDVVRYVPGVNAHQGENNRDEIIIRGNDSSSSFFLNGMRDDVQYYRDLYNVERTEILKGPNALSFGRGGGGGVLNRVTKEAGFTPLHEIVLEGGSFGNKRVAADFDQPFSEKLAFRMNGVYENSDSFRNGVGLERYGINPTLTYTPSSATRFTLGFENFRDDRTADRGITSFRGQPVDVPIGTFYGNPKDSYARALVNIGSVLIEHQFGKVLVRNRSLLANYDRGYQNYVPGAVNAAQTSVTLSAYNNATDRTNVLNQTDVITSLKT